MAKSDTGRSGILPQLIARRAEEAPHRLYLLHVDGSKMTYGEAHNSGRLWAGGLERLGVVRGATVALLLPNGFDIPVIWLGCGWLGARVAVINPAYRGRMLENAIATSGASVVITNCGLSAALAGVESLNQSKISVIYVDAMPSSASDQLHSKISRKEALAGIELIDREGPQLEDVAALIFTSGTTGPSKAVAVHWAQLLSTSNDATLAYFGPEDSWYSPLPMFHLTGLGPLLKMALAGGRVVIRESFSVNAYFDDIIQFGATGAVVIESMMQMLMKRAESGEFPSLPLRYIVAVPVPSYIDTFKKRFGVQVSTMYNMTELGGPVCSDGFNVTSADAGSCGRLRAGFEAVIADPLDYPVEDGETGELLIRPLKPWTTSTEYVGNPQATAEAWRNGWFHTGDAFRRDKSGRYFFVDRLKDAIRRRGENISSLEVEQELLAHPSVRECAALPHRVGETEEVKVFIVASDAASFDPAKVVEFLIPRMTHFMVPRFFELIDALPRTPSQKVQKHLLRAMGNSAVTWDREAAGIVLRQSSSRAS